MRHLGAIGLLTCILSSSSFAAQWVRAKAGSSGANLHQKPSLASPALGKYQPGSALLISTPPRGEFYVVYFQKEWKNTHYAYVPVSEVEVDSSAGRSASGKSSSKRAPLGPHPWSATLHLSLFQMNPTTAATAIHITPASAMTIGYGVDIEGHLYSLFTIWGSLSHYSLSQGTTVLLQASGWNILAGIGADIYRTSSLSLQGLLGFGFSLNSAGNTLASGDSVSTSYILGNPVSIGVGATYALSSRLAASMRLGILMHSLKSVPVLPVGATNTVETELQLGGLNASLGIKYQF